MKIIHLSDTHIGRNFNGTSNAARTELIVQDIFSLGNPQEYVIVHTGDLINESITQEKNDGEKILTKLVENGWRVLLAPGNHDYGNSMHVDPIEAAQFQEQFSSFIFGAQPHHFPVLTLIDDCAFIGLDSNAGEMSWLTRWFAEGNCGAQQIASLSAILDLPEVRNKTKVLYLHHHPFFDSYIVSPDVDDGHYFSHLFNINTRRFRRLKDAYSLLQCCRDRVDLLLFGHQHFGLDYSAEGQRYGIPIALDGSSSTGTEMDTDRMRYRIIDTTTGLINTRFIL